MMEEQVAVLWAEEAEVVAVVVVGTLGVDLRYLGSCSAPIVAAAVNRGT